MSEVKAALEFAKSFGLKGDEADSVSKIAKRMFSMTVAGGAISSLLFAYKKAKNSNVKRLLEKYGSDVYSSIKEEEERRWGAVTAFILKEAIPDVSGDGELIGLMEKLHDRNIRGKVERRILRYLNALSRVLDALA